VSADPVEAGRGEITGRAGRRSNECDEPDAEERYCRDWTNIKEVQERRPRSKRIAVWAAEQKLLRAGQWRESDTEQIIAATTTPMQTDLQGRLHHPLFLLLLSMVLQRSAAGGACKMGSQRMEGSIGLSDHPWPRGRRH